MSEHDPSGKEKGLEPYTVQPDMDPMAEPQWSMLMVFAWVMWLHPDRVREFWDKARQRTLEWNPSVNVLRNNQEGVPGRKLDLSSIGSRGGVLGCQGIATTRDLDVSRYFGDGPDALIGRDEAESSILAALRRGDLTAAGVVIGEKTPREITVHEWQYLRFGQRHDARPTVEPEDGKEGNIFLDVLFPSERVRELWPDTVGDQIDDQPERLTPKEDLIRKAVEAGSPVDKNRPGDGELADRINAVIDEARLISKKHSYRRMATLICQPGGGTFRDFKESTVVKIISDRYNVMKRLSIKANISAKDPAAKK